MRTLDLFNSLKSTLKILSIDFDVFYDLGTQFIPSIQISNIDWVINYNTNSDTMGRTFYYDLFYKLKHKISELGCPVYVSEDHSHIAHVVEAQFSNHILDIVNYDRHADIVGTLGNSNILNCSNWVGWLSRTHSIKSYNWVCWGNDYYVSNLGRFIDKSKIYVDGFKTNIITNTVHRLDEDYDLVFIIQSYNYSPPHMFHRFRELYSDLPNVSFDDKFPLWEFSYKESVERLKEHESGIFLHDSISKYTGKEVTVCIDPQYIDDYDSVSEDIEDYTVQVRKEITRQEFIEMFGECDPNYAN